jgi:serine/threonine protein kinase
MMEYHNRVPDTMLGVASGLQYLHSKKILLRDLKPSNIGFSKRGTVKIFDLGFARHEEDCQDGELCGSYRYMAPELYEGGMSTFSCDVYSFSLILFEVLTLEKPYNDIITKSSSSASSAEDVRHHLRRQISLKCDGGSEWRHSVDEVFCAKTRELIQNCWNPNPDLRPDFESIYDKLEDACNDMLFLNREEDHKFEAAMSEDHNSKQQRRNSASPLSQKFTRTLSSTCSGFLKRRNSLPSHNFQRQGSRIVHTSALSEDIDKSTEKVTV